MVPAVFQAAIRRKTAPAVCLASALMTLAASSAFAFSLDDVTARARTLVQQPYAKPATNLPPVFSSMQFADYQKMQPRLEKLAWKDLDTPFKLSFYHQGMHFNTPVKINEVVNNTVTQIKYDPASFDFGDLNFDKETTSQLGYAGFRVLFPVNDGKRLDEVMSLLGASYFRVIGKDQIYGLSGRGLAIDTAMGHPEEFPDFREFWIERPRASDKHLVMYALMDSPRATGAYRFVLRPGEDSVLDVQSRIFMRDKVGKIGIAPLTSMFLFGPNQKSATPNFRPALHDSNGLAIHTGSNEWLWRPLNNPKHLAVSTFQVDNPKGFGLLQRGREFSRYEDIKDRYDLRPSAWIEPVGNWGKGHVELVEIPTGDETNDNIVAFWTPEKTPAPGQAMQFDYRMHWTMNEPALMDPNVAWVKQTLTTPGEIMQRNLIRHLDGSLGLLVDFEGPALEKLPAGAPVSAQISVGPNAEVIETVVQRNPAIKGWRLNLRVKVKDPKQVVEMRANLVEGNRPLSETWSFQLPPHSVTVN